MESPRSRVPLGARRTCCLSIDYRNHRPTPFACCLPERRVGQTPNPVLELGYLRPVNSNGRRLDRSIILHFLSMGEFVDAVLQDDFELGVSSPFRVEFSVPDHPVLLPVYFS